MVAVTCTHGLLEAVGDLKVPIQGLHHTGEQEEVSPHQCWGILQVFHVQDGVGGEPNSDCSRTLNRSHISAAVIMDSRGGVQGVTCFLFKR